jgi:hypothetical protein
MNFQGSSWLKPFETIHNDLKIKRKRWENTKGTVRKIREKKKKKKKILI